MRGMREKSAVILDRHPLWLDAMDKLLHGVGIEVVGRATSGDEAVEMVEQHCPDVLVAGVDGSSGELLASVLRAKTAHAGLKAVVVGDSTDTDAIDAAFASGASIYCVKTAEQEDLASAIRQAFERSIFIATGEALTVSEPRSTAEVESAARELTKRELEILRLVAEGYSNSQLAKMLWVTEQTVKFHLSNTYRKLNVANRTEASRWAQVNGLLPPRKQAAAEMVAA
jgi:DNA-binding NarL/FixJ family response regulator